MKTALLVTWIGVAVAACSSPPKPAAKPPEPCPAVDLQLELGATARLNPSPEGEGRPVQVRVYQLQSDATLRSATFDDIWQKDQEILKTDLKSVGEYTVFPGKTQLVSLKRNPEAHFLAFVALFREPQGKDWYVSYELEQPRENPPCAKPEPLSVFLDRMQIQDGEGRGEETEGTEDPATANPSADSGEGGN